MGRTAGGAPPVWLSCIFPRRRQKAYLPRSFRASSHSFLGSRSPFFASSIINFAIVSWDLGDRLAEACSLRRRVFPHWGGEIIARAAAHLRYPARRRRGTRR